MIASSKLLPVLFVLFLFVGSGCSLIEKEQQRSYLKTLEAESIAGSVSAQIALADEFERGANLPKDLDKALMWYRAAAKNGSAEGAYKAASILLLNPSINSGSNSPEAVGLLQQAAEAGYAPAQLKLADILAANSAIDSVGMVRVFELYLAAASQNLRDAQYKAANLLELGRGTEKDLGSALAWYRLAAEQGDARAQLAVGNFYLAGITVNPSAARALEWYEQSARQGSKQAQSNMGDLLTLDRYAGLRDYKAGAEWYRKAALQGHSRAGARLGEMYEKGLGVTQDAQTAATWYRAAAEQGDASGQCRLASLYVRGLGVSQNTNEAKRWFNLAAAQIPTGVKPVLGFVYYDCEQFNRDEVDLLSLVKPQ